MLSLEVFRSRIIRQTRCMRKMWLNIRIVTLNNILFYTMYGSII
jgi:hypothetical protein